MQKMQTCKLTAQRSVCMFVYTCMPQVHMLTQTPHGMTSLTLSPVFSSFASFCIMKMLIETKSPRRFVITCAWVRVWTQSMFVDFQSSSHTYLHLCADDSGRLCICVCVFNCPSSWWYTVLLSWKARTWPGKSLIFICSSDSTVTSQKTGLILTYMHTIHTKRPRQIFLCHTHTDVFHWKGHNSVLAYGLCCSWSAYEKLVFFTPIFLSFSLLPPSHFVVLPRKHI